MAISSPTRAVSALSRDGFAVALGTPPELGVAVALTALGLSWLVGVGVVTMTILGASAGVIAAALVGSAAVASSRAAIDRLSATVTEQLDALAAAVANDNVTTDLLDRSRRVRTDSAQARALVNRGRSSLLLNPRGQRHRGTVEATEVACRHLERIAIETTGLTRTVVCYPLSPEIRDHAAVQTRVLARRIRLCASTRRSLGRLRGCLAPEAAGRHAVFAAEGGGERELRGVPDLVGDRGERASRAPQQARGEIEARAGHVRHGWFAHR